MASAPPPSSLFLRLATAWGHLSLRSDVDDIILELLGHFSLEKIYAGTGPGERRAYQHLVKSLLAQLSTIFYIQRLTLPAENAHVGWYLGFLVSWEVTLRSVELVLQIVAEGRESLWEDRPLRDRYLAEFLLSALRILTLHPKAAANQRAKDRRDRFARIHRSLEQVFDSYPGPKSFLLEVCKEVTNRLHVDPDTLGLPSKLRYETPNLTSELYPLADCLSPNYISELAPACESPVGWLPQFLALRDISQFVVGASIQYAANRETRDVRLQSASAASRNAILGALDNIRIPFGLSRVDMVAAFSNTFRIILPDTPDLSRQDTSGSRGDEYELDAVDALCARLKERQVIHRMSDRETMINVSQVVRNILLQDDPAGQSGTARPSLYAVNCPQCHLVGGSQIRTSNIDVPSDSSGALEVRLPPRSRCHSCGEVITMVREISLARRTWELLRPLEPDADTINVERHLPTHFQLGPPKFEAGLLGSGYSAALNEGEQSSGAYQRPKLESSTSVDRTRLVSPLSPQSSALFQAPASFHAEVFPPNSHQQQAIRGQDFAHDMGYTPPDVNISAEPSPFSQYKPAQPSTKLSPMMSPTDPRTIPSLNTPPEKGKSKWRLKFAAARKPSIGTSADSSSLSSTALEAQKLEEIPLGSLCSASKTAARGKSAKNVHVELSQSSSLALFWTQLSIHVWDVGMSPPIMTRAISTESTCLLAAVAKLHLAYVIGTRDQRLTLRIINLLQPSTPAAEYRISSSLWCKSIAIDREENYVVIGFESATVRFFKTTNTEQPREDRLHSLYHADCRGCPSVDTLSFSSDGLNLLAGMRSLKSGVIQVYAWKFPFLTFQETASCRYHVPLHESEDNGLSSVVFRPGTEGEDNLICISTWTQSGTPILVQPQDGHRSEIRTDSSGRQNKLGSRIQCAVFSPSGKELAMVNDKGYLYQVSNLNSNVMDVKKVATSRELTARSDSFSVAFMTLSDEEYIVLAWADALKAAGWVKKIPTSRVSSMFTASCYSANCDIC
ncbi:hypothetical protein B0H66DRAFT_473656 [Apodospora peruviana]|uniref:WD40 repeat protein n=1 Tax=Apodospora peruviana TaxID=516989 RepID=A0AAE0IBJ0_9PEZI|nr:hypothetical protein B0H66DRAFT_473656 [Apodospora peruviana]